MTIFVDGGTGPDIVRVYLPSPSGAISPELEESSPDVIVVPVDSEGFSGITQTQHDQLFSLSHTIESSHFTEIETTGENISRVTAWESASKVRKIRETQVTYNGSGDIDFLVTDQYSGTGVLIKTLTKVLNYVGGEITSITTTASTP